MEIKVRLTMPISHTLHNRDPNDDHSLFYIVNED